MEFRKYLRGQQAEMRPVTETDISCFQNEGELRVPLFDIDSHIQNVFVTASLSEFDLVNGSPKIGDMIARNPDNHNDQWLVAEDYFKKNFKVLDEPVPKTQNNG